MKTYELTVYYKDAGTYIISCKRMNIKEAIDFFRNHLSGDITSLKIEVYE